MPNLAPSNPLKSKRIIISLFVALLFAFPGYSLAGQFKVTMVYDGDTIKAEGHDIVIYVLLAGIDAPEIGSQKGEGQLYGREASKYLENLILNKTVDIKGYGLGPNPYNYLVGEIYLGNKNVNIDMIRRGFAEVCSEKLPEGLNISPYVEAEREAKDAMRGIWSLEESYVSPKVWRKTHRKK
jgi:micrococcal nuclease